MSEDIVWFMRSLIITVFKGKVFIFIRFFGSIGRY